MQRIAFITSIKRAEIQTSYLPNGNAIISLYTNLFGDKNVTQ
jgi:hypothetical protein